ncbi:MAG: 1-(5-phosphoribosyl)-5-[(5-phosphoribosylamino)methylideneamino]imidazole-4-carboxamide isomerase [Micavibrio sp.]
MIIYPAIHLKDGKCVRLHKGAMDEATIYSDNPASQALEWAQAGFSWLHVVDLNGAVGGHPVNSGAVREIIDAVDLPVQLGGGIRSIAQIESWLDEGVSRVILGTSAVKNPELVMEAARLFPEQILVGIDARGGRAAVEGWVEESAMDAIELALKFEDAGISGIVYTDIERDGTGRGLNMEATIAMAEAVSVPVIAAGGVAGLADIRAVRAAEKQGVAGIVIGTALYDGSIDIARALQEAA